MEKMLIKKIKLGEEVESSIKQIITALKELQTTVQDTSYYFIAFQLLSNGFERLLKCSICYGYLKHNNKFPTLKEIKKFSHNTEELFEHYITTYFVDNCVATKQDYEFIKNNKEVTILIKSLSAFGKNARYHNLNIITGDDSSIDIKETWQKLEMDFIMEDPELKKKLFDEPDFNFVTSSVTKHFVSIFEKLTRAIVRQFTLGDLGEEPKKIIGYYSHFLFIKDEDFGITDYYNKFFFKEVKVASISKKNKNKTIKILKRNYKDLWPFKNTDSVILEKSTEEYITIIINKRTYALNGFTSTSLGLPFPHDSNEAFVGRSISYFIDTAIKL